MGIFTTTRRASAERGRGGRGRNRPEDRRAHVVIYVMPPPWRAAGQRQRTRAPGRREALALAKALRSDGCTVVAIRAAYWWER